MFSKSHCIYDEKIEWQLSHFRLFLHYFYIKQICSFINQYICILIPVWLQNIFVCISFVTVYMFMYICIVVNKIELSCSTFTNKITSLVHPSRVSLSNPGAQTKLAHPKMLVSPPRAIFLTPPMTDAYKPCFDIHITKYTVRSQETDTHVIYSYERNGVFHKLTHLLLLPHICVSEQGQLCIR